MDDVDVEEEVVVVEAAETETDDMEETVEQQVP